jgi:hypothetical protein
MKQNTRIANYSPILLAGLAGGTAELLWIMAYSSVNSVSSVTVAQQIVASIWPAAAQWPFAPVFGVFIHLVLSIILVALAAPILSRIATQNAGAGFIVTSAAILLALVWTVNFFIILPVVNPAFITLLPYSVSLASKLLFGVAMGMVLYNLRRPQNPSPVSRQVQGMSPAFIKRGAPAGR